MRQLQVEPTARAYEVWTAYCSHKNPGLCERLEELIEARTALTSAMIDALHEEFLIGPRSSETETERLLSMTECLDDTAVALLSNAAESRAVIRTYSEALQSGAEQLGRGKSEDEKLIAIKDLATETFRAAERNRALERQLAIATAQVERLRAALAEQRQAASTDELTGLANRRGFDSRLRKAVTRAASGVDETFSLLLLDVDHFKRFNDTWGHRSGDLVLRLLGRLLIDSVKGRDFAARYGGEEFAVILIGADLSAACLVARQIGTALAAKRIKVAGETEQGEGRVTISIGVAQFRPDDTVATLIDRADAAMYAAKRAGRNRVVAETELYGRV